MKREAKQGESEQYQGMNLDQKTTQHHSDFVHLLLEGESIVDIRAPVRPPFGFLSYLISALGIVFFFASLGAARELIGQPLSLLSLLTALLTLVLIACSLLWTAWPLIDRRLMSKTRVLLTNHAVIRVVQKKDTYVQKKRWAFSEIVDPRVDRVRGETASIILSEKIRQKSDGTPVYMYEAVHGLENAESFLDALNAQKAKQHQSS